MKKMLCNAAIVIVAILGVVSCDNDLTPLGANFLGEDPEGVIKEEVFDVKTYSVPVNPVQTNNFTSFPFGVYEDPVYGTSTYSFVSQLNLAFANPTFGDNIELLDVTLEVPYFSTAESIENEVTTYVLDSIYGDQSVSFKIYRNNYFLSSFDNEDVTQNSVFYSDFESVINLNKGELIYQNDSFIPSEQEVTVSEVEEVDGESVTTVTERLSPRLKTFDGALDIEQWKDILFIVDASTGDITGVRPELASASLFQDYFRGLYFQIDGVSGDGNMIHFDLNNASVVLTVRADSTTGEDTDGDGEIDVFDTLDSEITLNFNGNRIGFIDNDFGPSIISDIQSSNDPVSGAENLYLKGGSGSVAVVELFGQATNPVDGEAIELSEIIENDWLINEASIEFYVNQSLVTGGEVEPERILIYNYDTNTLLADYVVTSTAISGINSNLSHLGRLERLDSDDLTTDGVSYKIRLTQHLNNIIQGDIENDRLAIAVSQNVNLITSSQIDNSSSPTSDQESIPTGTAISHEGTIIYGNLAVDDNGDPSVKRPVLKVFYTETTN